MLLMHCDNCDGWATDSHLKFNYLTVTTNDENPHKVKTWHFCCMNCAGVYFISHSQPTEEVDISTGL